jgi:hypothetical protein
VSVITLEDYTPAQRFDGNPWTHAVIEEAADSAGPWTVLVTINLSPVDTDPADPQARAFTVTNATLDSGWYRVTWTDAVANTQVTPPVQRAVAGASYADVQDVRARAGALLDHLRANPTAGELEGFLADRAGTVNSVLWGMNQDPGALNDAGKQALVPMVAYGALVDALGARYPGAQPPSAPAELRARAQAEWDDALAALRAGEHPAIGGLQTALSGSSFWQDEPGYLPDALRPSRIDPLGGRYPVYDPNLDPENWKGMPL